NATFCFYSDNCSVSCRYVCSVGGLSTSALARDLLHPSIELQRRQHKKKRLVQSPNSYFMDVKCPGCYKITTVFSHAQTVVLCVGCATVLCQSSGGKARLTEGCSFRKKQH
uniref:40S ribosomal protein S27 n=1 Tax=Gasterosteus aculeatus aculeatus TaxID=481459 RepID=A0AAQ4P5K1_GASAC